MYVPLSSLVGLNSLLHNFRPSQPFFQPRFLPSIQPSDLYKRFDKLRETLISQGSPNDSLSFWNPVPLLKWHAVAIGVRDESEGGRDEVWFGCGHELGAGDRDGLRAGDV